MGQSEHFTGIADAEPQILYEFSDRFERRFMRCRGRLLKPPSRLPILRNPVRCARGKKNIIHELDDICIINPKPEGLSNSLPSLRDTSSLRVAPRNILNGCDPPSVLIELVFNDVFFHVFHQSFGRQGERSRLILESKPAPSSSPLCTGIVVEHFPHRTRAIPSDGQPCNRGAQGDESNPEPAQVGPYHFCAGVYLYRHLEEHAGRRAAMPRPPNTYSRRRPHSAAEIAADPGTSVAIGDDRKMLPTFQVELWKAIF
jgi:hypothetical protein